MAMVTDMDTEPLPKWKSLRLKCRIRHSNYRPPMDRVKIVVTSVLALTLALVSAAHALSSATARSSPELALAVWPANGLARERLTYRSFVEYVRKSLPNLDTPSSSPSESGMDRAASISSDQLRQGAAVATPEAIKALRDEPLLPKAHAILALSQKEALRREQIVTLGSALNRRDISLQGLVLESHVASGDYGETIATLDQILRVHPDRQAEFFPALTAALRQRTATSTFRNILSTPLPWRDRFLMFAVEDTLAARNLATIRQTRDFDNSDFDKRIITNLVRNNDIKFAMSLYEKMNTKATTKTLRWSSAYPPFDWTFADQSDLRAQPSKDGRDLEFEIDPGTGGVFASKLIDPPRAPFVVTVRHQLEVPSLSKDLKLSLTCTGKTQPFFQASFAGRKGHFDVDQMPNCGHVLLAISGRSWSGAEPLNGSITDLLIAAR